MATSVPVTTVGCGIVAYAPRERARELLKRSFPKRRGRLIIARSAQEFAGALRRMLVDAAIVDLAQPSDDSWRAAALAREFPSVPFFGLAPMRVTDTGTVSKCVELEFADVIAEGMDDAAFAELIMPHTFTRRFAAAMHDAHKMLGLDSPVQQRAWQAIVAHGGRLLRTETIALELHVTREHLSRSFSAAGNPNLKRIIDLVRLIAAAELAKNPGYDVGDVSEILEFASPSHLTSTSQRILGAGSASLARLRTADLIDRFKEGRGRSRKKKEEGRGKKEE